MWEVGTSCRISFSKMEKDKTRRLTPFLMSLRKWTVIGAKLWSRPILCLISSLYIKSSKNNLKRKSSPSNQPKFNNSDWPRPNLTNDKPIPNTSALNKKPSTTADGDKPFIPHLSTRYPPLKRLKNGSSTIRKFNKKEDWLNKKKKKRIKKGYQNRKTLPSSWVKS